MEQQQQQTQNPPPPPPTTTTTTSTTAQPTETPSQPPSQPTLQPPQQQHQQEPTPTPTPTPPLSLAATTAITSTNTPNPSPSPNPNANVNPNPIPNSTAKPTSLTPAQPRPASFSRPWQQPQQQQHSHFSHLSSTSTSTSTSTSVSPSSSVSSPISAPPRGGIAIGVPAPRPSTASPQPAPPFSASFGQQFGGLGRGGVKVPDSVSTSSALKVRPPGMQGIGVMGSLGSSSQMRPGGISVQHHQQRPVQQSSLRPPSSSPSSQSSTTPNFQGQGLMRVSPVGSPGSPSPNTSQSVQSFNQPWLSSGSQGKPPLPPPSTYRPQMNTPSMQQRSHITQQHSPLSTNLQQQHVASVQQQQSKPSHQLQEHYGQQFSSPRVPQSATHQQQTRPQGSVFQKSSSVASVQPSTVLPGNQSKIASAESDEFGNRILSKRSIHELVNQIDPSERLDSEVEDILVDIAEDFVESITAFGCSLAKHRQSDTLEAKDILLHLERNWNMTLPGFSGDEIKTYRKPLTIDIHKERLAVIKKSVMASEVTSTRTAGQASINAKGNMGKMPASIIGST